MQALSQVRVIPNFRASRWERERRIFVYLPPGYESETTRRYPVLYMHAGQRIFEPVRPDADSWNVHLAVDRLIREGRMPPIIVVGIAHVAADGTNEFFHDVGRVGETLGVECTGERYEDFIVRDLKPYVDDRFRTLTGSEHTALMGSPAAAVSTYNIGMRRPDVFGMLGILSPYLAKVECEGEDLRESMLYEPVPGKRPVRIWLDVGTHEGLFLCRYVRELARFLSDQGYRYGEELAYYEAPGAAHFEADWARRVHMPLLFFFGDRGAVRSVELHGRSEAGLTGATVCWNLVVTFDSGFAMTDLDGEYDVERPDIVRIGRDETLMPQAAGETFVTYRYGELHASKRVAVVAHLPERVWLDVKVNVPEDTPEDAVLYMGMGMRLEKAPDGTYRGRFPVPRDTGFAFRFTRGFRLFELDRDGRPIPNRTLLASDDLELEFTVENWVR